MAECKYDQLRDWFNKWKHQMRPANPLNTFEEWCVNLSEPGHMLSRMYKLVLSANGHTIPYYIREWENGMGHNFTTEQVDRLMETTHHSSISSYIREMSYTFLTRWYRTPTRLVQMYPSADINCWRGCNQKGSFTFMVVLSRI